MAPRPRYSAGDPALPRRGPPRLCPPSSEFDLTATSHSSLAQASVRHQSPVVLHGPAMRTTLPCTLRLAPQALICVGYPRSACTMARNGGRKTLKPRHCRLPMLLLFLRLCSSLPFNTKRFTRNASG